LEEVLLTGAAMIYELIDERQRLGRRSTRRRCPER
jgi:hypothetical protein